jgi:hypothetical protein
MFIDTWHYFTLVGEYFLKTGLEEIFILKKILKRQIYPSKFEKKKSSFLLCVKKSIFCIFFYIFLRVFFYILVKKKKILCNFLSRLEGHLCHLILKKYVYFLYNKKVIRRLQGMVEVERASQLHKL